MVSIAFLMCCEIRSLFLHLFSRLLLSMCRQLAAFVSIIWKGEQCRDNKRQRPHASTLAQDGGVNKCNCRNDSLNVDSFFPSPLSRCICLENNYFALAIAACMRLFQVRERVREGEREAKNNW